VGSYLYTTQSCRGDAASSTDYYYYYYYYYYSGSYLYITQSCRVIASSTVFHSWSLIPLNLVPTVVSSWHSTAFSTHYNFVT